MGNSKFGLTIDESVDAKRRKICNFLIFKIDGTKQEKYLIKSVEVLHANSSSILTATNEVLNWFFKGNCISSNFCLLSSDQAPYMLKFGKDLKIIYQNLKHVTCVVHAIHRACEKFREENPKLDKFIALFKEIHHKNDNLKIKFFEKTNLKIPKYPVVTRWGTWIKFGIFLSKNFQIIKEYFLLIKNNLTEKSKKFLHFK